MNLGGPEDDVSHHGRCHGITYGLSLCSVVCLHFALTVDADMTSTPVLIRFEDHVTAVDLLSFADRYATVWSRVHATTLTVEDQVVVHRFALEVSCQMSQLHPMVPSYSRMRCLYTARGQNSQRIFNASIAARLVG